MVKRLSKAVLAVVVFVSAIVGTTCVHPYGSVGKASVEEALRADAIAVTPCIPGWLLEPEQIHTLSKTELRELLAILRRGEHKEVHEAHYRAESPTHHEGAPERVFYLYASNAQCLGACVVGEMVLMDDMELTEEDSRALYRLLKPRLEKVLGGLQ